MRRGKKNWLVVAYWGAALLAAALVFTEIVALLANPRAAQARGDGWIQIIGDLGFLILFVGFIHFSRTPRDFKRELEREKQVEDWKKKHPDLAFLYEMLTDHQREEQERADRRALWLALGLGTFFFVHSLLIPTYLANLH